MYNTYKKKFGPKRSFLGKRSYIGSDVTRSFDTEVIFI